MIVTARWKLHRIRAGDPLRGLRPGPVDSGGRRFMAEYAILIYEDEAEWGKTAPEWIQQVAKEHGQFAQQNGVSLRGGSQLQPTMTAKAVRGGTVSDGPMVATT